MFKSIFAVAAVGLAMFTGAASAEVDAEAARALAKKSNCLKCHAVDKKKDGPSFKETAAKYKDKPDGQEKLYTHLTTSPMVKVDGKEEKHEAIKTKDEAEIKNLIAWILSR